MTQESEPHTDLLADYDLFGNSFKEYVFTTACHFIGDEAVYSKFCTRQQNLGNSEVINRVQAVKNLKNLIEHVKDRLEQIKFYGHEKVYNVCECVARQNKLSFQHMDRWVMCSFTGHQTSKVICIEDGLFVDAQYTLFVYSYWLCSKLEYIESCRVLQYMRDTFTAGVECSSISENIEEYMQSSYFPAQEHIRLYFEAFKYVLSTFDKTIQTIQKRQADKA